jgi:hypothetical protein
VELIYFMIFRGARLGAAIRRLLVVRRISFGCVNRSCEHSPPSGYQAAYAALSLRPRTDHTSILKPIHSRKSRPGGSPS